MVEAHRRNIMRKLSLRTIADLTRYAIREGLVD
jgi:DNA-binding NarL/FixJ family response regulator